MKSIVVKTKNEFTCGNCGHVLKKPVKKCKTCGYELHGFNVAKCFHGRPRIGLMIMASIETEGKIVYPDVPVRAGIIKSNEQYRCDFCGGIIPRPAKWCPGCGATLNGFDAVIASNLSHGRTRIRRELLLEAQYTEVPVPALETESVLVTKIPVEHIKRIKKMAQKEHIPATAVYRRAIEQYLKKEETAS